MSNATTVSTMLEESVAELREGRIVVVCDDITAGGQGTLLVAAELATTETVNFMAREGRGLICVALTPERCDELGLEPIAGPGAPGAFTVSIEARAGVTTGISAADRARTSRVAADPAASSADLVQPGHVFPLKARAGGVLERPGHTEAAVDLARLAGLTPAGVLCAVMDDAGEPAAPVTLAAYCHRHGLGLVTISALVAHRRGRDRLVELVVTTSLPTPWGDFTVHGYRSLVDGAQWVALVRGDVRGGRDVPVRIQHQCFAGHVLRATSCTCREETSAALSAIAGAGRGVLLHFNPEAEPAHWVACGSPGALPAAGTAAQVLTDLGVLSTRSAGAA